jgi:hypothetical protein
MDLGGVEDGLGLDFADDHPLIVLAFAASINIKRSRIEIPWNGGRS